MQSTKRCFIEASGALHKGQAGTINENSFSPNSGRGHFPVLRTHAHNLVQRANFVVFGRSS